MAHTGICPEMACQRIEAEKKKRKTKKAVYQEVSKELGIPWRTVQILDNRKVKRDSFESQQPSDLDKEKLFLNYFLFLLSSYFNEGELDRTACRRGHRQFYICHNRIPKP